jgi:methylated-DNA-[protein]-cysteine S-methyltransferase
MAILYCYDFSICSLGIAEKDGVICRVFFNSGIKLKNYEYTETPLIKTASTQLTEYFSGKRKKFDFPIAFHGTEFQSAVWNALQKIPYGRTCSYGELAAMIGNPKASRAVGQANNRNPISIIVPCHRIIGHSGRLTGYNGGLGIKEQLLELEKEN